MNMNSSSISITVCLMESPILSAPQLLLSSEGHWRAESPSLVHGVDVSLSVWWFSVQCPSVTNPFNRVSSRSCSCSCKGEMCHTQRVPVTWFGVKFLAPFGDILVHSWGTSARACSCPWARGRRQCSPVLHTQMLFTDGGSVYSQPPKHHHLVCMAGPDLSASFLPEVSSASDWRWDSLSHALPSVLSIIHRGLGKEGVVTIQDIQKKVMSALWK